MQSQVGVDLFALGQVVQLVEDVIQFPHLALQIRHVPAES